MRFLSNVNLRLLTPVVLISSLSVMMLLSLDASYSRQQLIFSILGLCLFVVLSYFDYRLLLVYWRPIYMVMLIVLALTLIAGVEVRGSVRWLDFGILRIQPSELAKLVVTISLSAFFTNLKDSLTFSSLIKASMLAFFPAFMIFLQPDLGTSLVLIFVFGVLVFFKRVKLIYYVIFFCTLGLVSGPIWNGLREYQKERILVFFNPELDPLGAGYNVLQARIAIGSGRLIGKGFGEGTQSKLKFLPENHTDFIFASYAEEWGLVGVILLLTLFFFLLYPILDVVNQAKDNFSFYLSVGIFSMLLFQIFVNVGMNLGLSPVTGIPLPFVSYGGSSVFTGFLSLGLVNSIWVHSRR